MPSFRRNFVVKTVDGKVAGVQKALKAAGIEVTSVIEVYKEELPEAETPEAAEAQATDAAKTPEASAPSPPAAEG